MGMFLILTIILYGLEAIIIVLDAYARCADHKRDKEKKIKKKAQKLIKEKQKELIMMGNGGADTHAAINRMDRYLEDQNFDPSGLNHQSVYGASIRTKAADESPADKYMSTHPGGGENHLKHSV